MQGEIKDQRPNIIQSIQAMGLHTTHENTEVTHKSDVVFLAVKPPHVSKVRKKDED